MDALLAADSMGRYFSANIKGSGSRLPPHHGCNAFSTIRNAPPWRTTFMATPKTWESVLLLSARAINVIGDDAALMDNDNAVRIGRGEIQIMQNDKGPESAAKAACAPPTAH